MKEVEKWTLRLWESGFANYADWLTFTRLGVGPAIPILLGLTSKGLLILWPPSLI